MIPYLLLASFPVVLSWFLKDLNENKRNRKIFLKITGIVLLLMTALRSKHLGSTDTQVYYNYFEKAINAKSWSNFIDPESSTEMGFQIFNFILSRVFKDPQWIIVISSLIIISCTLYSIHKNSKDIALSVVMYITLGLWQFQIQGMRQALAISILLLAYECLKNRKYIGFALLVALATTFHVTAFVFAILLIIPFLKNIIYTIIASILFSTMMFVFVDDLIEIANVILETDYGVSNTDVGGFVATAIYILIILFAILFNKNLQNDKKENAMFFVTLIGTICYVTRYFGALAAERISFYFMFGQFILLPNSLEFLQEKEKKVVKLLVYMLMIGLFVYRLDSNGIFLPYRFFWQ